MKKCIECGKIFETFGEVRTHHKETGHFSVMMSCCSCPMNPECVHKLKDKYCNFQSSIKVKNDGD